MKYVLVMQNGEVMAGVEFDGLETAKDALEKYEAEYVAKIDIDEDGEEYIEFVG